MKSPRCCVPRTGTTSRRATGLAGTILSGITLVLMPKCPLCVATWFALFTGISLSTATAGHVRAGIIVLCLALPCIFLAACLVGRRNREH